MSDHYPPEPPAVPPNLPFGVGGRGQIPPPQTPGAYGQAPMPGASGQMPPNAMVPAPTSTNGFAVASLVMGVVSLFGCFAGIVTGIVGVIFGIVGLRQSHADPERFGGASGGMAIGGIILSVVAALGWAFVILFLWGAGNAGL